MSRQEKRAMQRKIAKAEQQQGQMSAALRQLVNPYVSPGVTMMDEMAKMWLTHIFSMHESGNHDIRLTAEEMTNISWVNAQRYISKRAEVLKLEDLQEETDSPILRATEMP